LTTATNLSLVRGRHREPDIPWETEGLDVVQRTSIKKFNAEFQPQAALEGTLELREENKLAGPEVEKTDYEGFYARPIGWEQVRAKFDRRTACRADAKLRGEIAAAVENLETIAVADLTRLLVRV
jgi:2-methylcitrate dehydratase PrpD